MSNKIIIRRAKEQDVEKIYAIGRKIHQFIYSKSSGFYSKKELREYIKKPKDNIFFVALREEKLVGFIYASIISQDWCMLDIIAVDPKFQDKGVGSLLLEELHETLKERKISYIQALVRAEFKKTREFWKRKGFKEGKRFIWIEKNI